MMVASWSCKDWSKPKSSKLSPIQAMRDGVGTTAETCNAILDFLDRARVPAWIGENLDDMCKNSSELKQLIKQALWDRDYILVIFPLDAAKCGACTARKRMDHCP
mmetsp:Transcript_7081/g.16025  ORF Transcript_7081/g.16025 Transcript_7081/m.16025 type:complete len:105 (-) Transcript_7081:838-1152(-)